MSSCVYLTRLETSLVTVFQVSRNPCKLPTDIQKVGRVAPNLRVVL
jgi:hypothetical protein